MATRPLVLFILAAIAVFSIAPCTADNAISSRSTLYAGQSLFTDNYQFIMQEDCNLVLYDSGNPIWASNTGGVAVGCRTIIQEDGNLVIYDNNDRQVWATNTGGPIANYVLVLQQDRNVVIYGPAIWATNTHTGTVGVTVFAQNSTNSTASAAVAAAAFERVIVNVA